MHPHTEVEETAFVWRSSNEESSATANEGDISPGGDILDGQALWHFTREQGWNMHGEEYGLPVENVVIAVITSMLSTIGSYVILREVVVDHQQTRGKTIARLLMSLSVADLCLSFGTMMSTFASPRELEYLRYNVGTVSTCEFQGFLMVLGYVASPLFNTTLAYQYLRMVRHHATEAQLARFEPLVHGCIWGVALAIATVPLPFDMYNNAFETCWVAPFPYGCNYNDRVPCERGDKIAKHYDYFLALFPALPCLLACMIILRRMWGAVRGMEDANAKYATNFIQPTSIASVHAGKQVAIKAAADRRKSNIVRQQAVLYVLAFLVTYLFWWLDTLLWLFGIPADGPLDLIAYSIFAPLQGFLNCLVFVRQRDMRTPEGRFFRAMVCFWNSKDPQIQKLKDEAAKRAERRQTATVLESSEHPLADTSLGSRSLDTEKEEGWPEVRASVYAMQSNATLDN